ncbi:glycerate kinase [Motilibacter rhizosphaerae]|uniref:Glycerate kinase n=1 Tax=Motilibacter rhizosphaerae TaxID=598652 RepID=A0A4V2F2V6_9ACTN|nr:glycerate kinase [Motilibacter rhizosphaerae]RZS80224.1 glycerate kinase [Motilibacter rhizosphaerae]
MRVVLAPDSFKGTVPATRVAAALADGWRSVRPGDELVLLPLADGGEGSLDALELAVPGAVRRAVPGVSGPDGRPVDAAWLLLPDRTGVAELAVASGLPLLDRPDPLGAHTRGLGEVLAAALAEGVDRLVVCVGGSASTDGGTGLLAALGVRFLDGDGRPLPLGGGALDRLSAVDLHRLVAAPPGGVDVLVDVAAPLTGPAGAAAVFGPQKGASPGDVALLDRGLLRLASLLGGDPAAPGAGAAGGTAYGLAAAWGARLVPGAARVAELVGLAAALAGADLLVTGEGRFDATSLTGKAPAHALALARDAGVRTAVVAGQLAIAPPADTALALVDLAGGVAPALAEPEEHLRAAGAALAATPPP